MTIPTQSVRIRNMPTGLWKAVKGRALDEERSVYALVIDALTRYLDGVKTAERKPLDWEIGR